MNKSNNLTLLLLSITHIVNDSNIIILSTVIPLIVDEFKLSYTETSLVVNIIFLSMIILQIFVGDLSEKINVRFLLGLGILTLGIGGLLTIIASNFHMLLMAQFVAGLGASFYHPIAYGLTRSIYRKTERGFAFGIVTSAGDIGVLTVFLVSGFLSLFYNWRIPVLIFSLLAILSALISLIFLKPYSLQAINEKKRDNYRLFTKRIIFILIAYMLIVSVNRISYSFIPLILDKRLPNQAMINMFISILVFSGISGELVSGIIIDRYNVFLYIIVITIIMILAPITLIFKENIFITILSLSFLGYVMYSNMPIIYGYVLGGDIESRYGTIYGITVSLGMIGGFVSSTVAGFFADIYGINITMYLISLISFTVLMIYTPYFLLEA